MNNSILADENEIYNYFVTKKELIESELSNAKSTKQHDIANAKLCLLGETMAVVFGVNKEG